MRRLDDLKGFVADLARPFAIWSSAGAAAFATVRIAWVGENFIEAAAFITAVWAGVGALYVGKAWENRETAKQGASVEIAKAAGAPPAPGTATVVAAADVEAKVTVEDKPGAGELPPDQRVRL